jgi:hypothetical protein
MSDNIKSQLMPEDVFGKPISRDKALSILQSYPDAYEKFLCFPREVQDSIITFITGQKSITINYDPFFKKIFDPLVHPKRLESLISAILGFDVLIESVLPREGVRLSSESSFVIMDVVVRLANGAYLSVEIQKIGYNFPGERTACYASDLILRQYDLQRKVLGDKFSYDKIHPVYVIVLVEQSSYAMSEVAPYYIHNRIVSYDSGAKIAELSNICYVSLDTFRNRGQNKIETPLDAWLTLLSEHEATPVLNLINQCPEFLDIYREIAEFRKNPKELINMYSQALAIMDHNMEVMMVEEARAELKEISAQLDNAVAQLDNVVAQRDNAVAQRDNAVAERDDAVAQRDDAVAERDDAVAQLNSANSEIAALKAQLAALTK